MFHTWGIGVGRALYGFPKWTIHSLCRQRYNCIGSSWGPRMYRLPSFLLSVTNDCSQGSDLLTFSNDVAGAYWTPDIISNISTYPSKGAFFHFNKQAHSNKQVSAACSMKMHEPPWKPRIISLYWLVEIPSIEHFCLQKPLVWTRVPRHYNPNYLATLNVVPKALQLQELLSTRKIDLRASQKKNKRGDCWSLLC